MHFIASFVLNDKLDQLLSAVIVNGEGIAPGALQSGDLETVETVLENDPSIIFRTTVYDRQSALHIAAANGQIEVLATLLSRSGNPDLVNRHKQTPLMLAAMHEKISRVEKLIGAGATILMFDSVNRGNCLHYAAYYGHSDRLATILSAARTSHIASVDDFYCYYLIVLEDFLDLLILETVKEQDIRDGKGATPLHLAARQKSPQLQS
ncbi:homeodomain transcription factor [Lithospermum erythrorhizon]|uniref:Homeodomain transcription factor n=1 Tax=Lithospermum erythrorhizon TaxID=34254 RepID=A0AAV3S281_LITER